MTTISNLSSQHLVRPGIRELGTEAGFTPRGLVTEQPSSNNKTGLNGSESAGRDTGTSALSLALLDMESTKAARTTLSGKAVDTSASDNLLAELQEWSQMTPADMIRAMVLEQIGITEDELATMPPDQRKAVEDMIEAAIKRSLDPNRQASNEGRERFDLLSL
jgi:hypothetical protein